MADAAIDWPQKTRELHNHHFDSTIWNDFTFRDDDIVIATYAKSGTTWVQQIVSQLLFEGAEGLEVADMSPWLDLRVPPKRAGNSGPSRRRPTAASSRPTPPRLRSCSNPRAK